MKALSLVLVLLFGRVMGSIGHHVVAGWLAPIAYLWHDAAVVLIFAAVERSLRARRRVVWTLYLLAASYAVINIPVQRVLWSPLTPTMWRAAGGALADSIWYYATPMNMVIVALGAAIIAFAPVICRRVAARPLLIALALCTALGPLAASHVDTRGAERNAWTALASGMTVRSMGAIEARDWRTSDLPPVPDADLAFLRGAAAARNVVLVSLESTAARYLGLYGASPDVAPNLSALAQSAVVFDNAYAVYPESIKGLFSILCSVSPGFDTRAESYAQGSCDSLAQVLGSRRYRTALFHSGRFEYLGMNAIIRDRGFDVLADAGDIGGRHDSSFGVDEPSTVDHVLRWIDSGPADSPFFITYLPIAGHHPYETPERGPYPDRDEFGRYRNALHYADAALGQLRAGLESRGLDRKTLWVVFGDHGEAFGQHEGNYGHTFQLYDENVHVPFVVALPGVIRSTLRADRVVSLVDTAPTVLEVLGVAAPPGYEGQSMLDPRPRAALFFTDYSLPLVGLRDGPRKIIYDRRSERAEWYDLDRDPDERVDLSARHRRETDRYTQILEAWIARESHAARVER
jgi:arylsulfatase A-like enzyme